MPDKRTLVVDVTYQCNGSCRYCQWANGPIPDRIDPRVDDLLLTPDWLGVLGTERVVLSGGEPALSPVVGTVLEHYSRYVAERVVITNGILMDGSRREELLDAGATGFTFSIDSLDPAINGASRGLDLREHRLVLDNLADAAQAREGWAFELGINTVVTTANARSASIHDLLRLAADLDLDFVKFNPVFDDGHAGRTAPELRLSGACVRELERIGNSLSGTGRISTNPAGFWGDLAALAGGQHIPARSCALAGETALLAHGRLALCFWVPAADLPFPDSSPVPTAITNCVDVLRRRKEYCDTGPHCWCMQPLEHVWLSG